MKTLIIFTTLYMSMVFQSLACQLSIPESYVPTFLNPPVSGHYMKCEDKPEEKCFCVDSVDPWASELVDNEVIDYISKLNETSCSDIADCDAKFIEISCNLEEEKIKNYDLLQVYCVKNIMKIEGKKLTKSEVKKAEREAIKEAKRIAREAKIAAKESNKAELFALKKADIDAMTVSQRNAVMIKLINIVQEIQE